MSESQDDVLHKLDALFKKHADSAPEIPVLTDLIEEPRLNLDVIPMLTEEVPPLNPASVLHGPEIELDLVPEPLRRDPLRHKAETDAMLARLAAVEAEVQADVEARIAKSRAVAHAQASIEIPRDAAYIALERDFPASDMLIADTKMPPAAAPLPASSPSGLSAENGVLSDAGAQKIAAILQTEIGHMLKASLHQTLAEELDGMLMSALDRAVSSMLEQFMVHMEEVVRATIVQEVSKQLLTLRKPEV